MDAYKLLATTFINLQTILKQNLTRSSSHNETVIKAIDDYQSSLFGYKTVSDLYSECYWFEPQLWWRKGPKLKCLPDELQAKTDEAVHESELKAFTGHIKGVIMYQIFEIFSYLWSFEILCIICNLRNRFSCQNLKYFSFMCDKNIFSQMKCLSKLHENSCTNIQLSLLIPQT